ncbi:glycosyltransferase family 4 protein [Flavobacterium sp.]|uniref:glycosyltransferase family 4 protein n=2 Tax=Flavobacterium sp. TaxID=239 RepID=UPI0040346D90
MQKKKKIVFINQATGYLTIDIINEFAKDYDEVALIAGSIRVQDIPLDRKVKWSKITKYDRGNPKKKFLSWLIGTIQIFFLLLFRYRRYEIFYITIPPSAYLLSLVLPNKFSVLVFDVYPDVLEIYNIKKTSLIYRSWARWNRKLFRKAHRVFTIGEGMARLLDAYMERDKMKIIPLWSGLTKIKPVAKADNPWLKDLGLQNKFIVQYSGNIGYTHNVEVMVDLAREFVGNPDIHFLIIGRGERVNHIKQIIEDHKLKNTSLLPFQPDDVLNYSLAAADLGVVILDEKSAHVSLPSKIYNLQAVAVPMLGISTLDSELNGHLELFDNGKCFVASDIKGMVGYINNLSNDKAAIQALSENSKKASVNFTIANAKKYYEEYVS